MVQSACFHSNIMGKCGTSVQIKITPKNGVLPTRKGTGVIARKNVVGLKLYDCVV